MRKTLLYRLRLAGARHPAVKRWLFLMLCACIAIKLLSAFGADDAMESGFRNYVSSPGAAEELYGIETWPLSRDFSISIPGLVRVTAPETPPEDTPSPPAAPEDTPPAGDSPGIDLSGGDTDGDTGIGESADPPAAHPADVYRLFSGEHLDASGIELSNRTDYEIDVDALLNEALGISIAAGEPSVLIVHTHGSEAYTADGGDAYEETEGWRTTDTEHNVVHVGDELAKILEGYGVGVVHDRSLHDYPAYSGAYNRSLASISEYLETYPSIKLVIDLHRDAIMDSSGKVYKTVAQIGDNICSQILLISGTNFSGLDHPYWQENLKLALRLQYAMNELYPSLAKPIQISQYRYNQHMTTGSLIVEVGCNGNTLREAIDAVGYFADAAASVILSVTSGAENIR